MFFYDNFKKSLNNKKKQKCISWRIIHPFFIFFVKFVFLIKIFIFLYRVFLLVMNNYKLYRINWSWRNKNKIAKINHKTNDLILIEEPQIIQSVEIL